MLIGIHYEQDYKLMDWVGWLKTGRESGDGHVVVGIGQRCESANAGVLPSGGDIGHQQRRGLAADTIHFTGGLAVVIRRQAGTKHIPNH